MGLIERVAMSRDADRPSQPDGGNDGELGGGVSAVDVLGGIGFGVAGVLRFAERIGKRGASRLHAAQDVVARPVENAAYFDEAIAGEAFLQRAQHGNAASHRCLEPDLRPLERARSSSSGAMVRHELLVRGHDRLARDAARRAPSHTPGAVRRRAR